MEYSLKIFRYARTFFQSFSLRAASRMFPNCRSDPRRCITSMLCSMAKYKKDVTIWLLFWMAISGRFSGFGGFPDSSVSAPRERIYRSNS